MYDRIKNIPTSRDGKMAFGVLCALIARAALNEGLALLPTDAEGALFAFLMTGFMLGVVGLALVRFDSGAPLFSPLKRSE